MPPRFPRSLAIAGREALAFAKQALLLRYDTSPVTPADARDGDDVVVLLHGVFATAGVTRPIRDALTRHPRVHAASFSYPPGPGVELLAARLAALVGGIPARTRLHLVGHSLGGVVARWFAQEVGDPRVVQTISIASPFAGIPRARLLGFDWAKDIDPGSPLLRRLALGAAGGSPIPHLSIIGAHDELIRAPVSHALPGGDVLVLDGRGHNTLLFDPEVTRAIEERVLRRAEAAA